MRAVASTLPRSYEVVVFPKELRAALVESAPRKFLLPPPSDLRFNWACARLDAISRDELFALVVSAWRMCVPKKVAAAYAEKSKPA